MRDPLASLLRFFVDYRLQLPSTLVATRENFYTQRILCARASELRKVDSEQDRARSLFGSTPPTLLLSPDWLDWRWACARQKKASTRKIPSKLGECVESTFFHVCVVGSSFFFFELLYTSGNSRLRSGGEHCQPELAVQDEAEEVLKSNNPHLTGR